MLTLLVASVVSIFFSNSLAGDYANVQELVPGEIFQMDLIKFHILCYKGQPKKLLNIWQSVKKYPAAVTSSNSLTAFLNLSDLKLTTKSPCQMWKYPTIY